MTKENRLLGTAEKELSAGHSRKRRLTPDRPPRNLQSSKPKSDPFPGKVSLIRALVIAALAVTVPAVPAYAFTLQTSTETGTATETSSMEIQVLETITVARDSNIVMSLNDETNTINLYLNDQVTGTSFTAGNSVLSTSGLTITGTKEQGDTYTPQALLSSAGLSITGGTDSSSSLTPDGISTTGTVSAGDSIYVGEDESQSVLTGTALTLASGVAYTSAGATVPVIGYQNSVSGSTLSNTIVVGSTNTVGSSTASVSDLILLGSGVTTDATDAVIISPSGGTYSGLSNITVIGSGANVTYNGATAVGIFIRPTENSMISLGGAVGNDDVMGNMSFSYRFGGESLEQKPAQMQAKLVSLDSENRDLSAQLAAARTRIEGQDQKLATQGVKLQTQAKTIETQGKTLSEQKATIESQETAIRNQKAELKDQELRLQKLEAEFELRKGSKEAKPRGIEKGRTGFESRGGSFPSSPFSSGCCEENEAAAADA